MPTRAQQRYADHGIMALIHFNMGTYVSNGDPACDKTNWLGPMGSHNPARFNPYRLDTDQWATVLKRLGAKHAVLTAKHGCGFLLWPSQVGIKDASTNKTVPYSYAVGHPSSAVPYDLIQKFVDSFRQVGLGVGFYYSLKNNFLVNMKNHHFINSTLLEHQILMTKGDYEEMALGHLRELWTNYGNLTEQWFDNGYTESIRERLAALLQEAQPDMAVWSKNPKGITENAITWDGTESGFPAGKDLWSAGCDGNPGHANDTDWCPKGCDTTLQDHDLWFYEPTASIRSLETMMEIYHHTVGRNGVLELDVAVDRTGRIRQDHALRYQEMGDYIQQCYGKPSVSVSNVQGYVLELELDAPTRMDRVWLREDQWQGGQRVRKYEVYVRTTAAANSTEWTLFSQGHSIGNKRIDIGQVWTITAIKIQVQVASDVPLFREIAVFAPCPVPNDFREAVTIEKAAR